MKTAHQIFFTNAGDMDAIPSGSVDLMITSPPYPMIEMWDQTFAGLDPCIGQTLDQGDGDLCFDRMHQVLDQVWRQVNRVLAPGAIACVNIGDATRSLHGRFRMFSNHSRIIAAFRELGFTVLPAIIWRKPTNAPNKFMGSGMLPPNAYMTLEHEYVLIFRKKGRRSFQNPGAKKQRYASAYFWEERNAWFSDIWFDLTGSSQSMPHNGPRHRSAAFPLELPLRLIHMFSVKKDMVLDPFLGTGTTMLAAMCAGRNSLGFEIDGEIEPLILQRIATVPEMARQHISRRLKAHCDFVQARMDQGKPFKHHNSIYDLPVVTKQETLIQLDLATQIEYHAGHRFAVAYQPMGRHGLENQVKTVAQADSPTDPANLDAKERQLKMF